MSKRTLTHLSKKVFNTPLFVTQEGLAPIASYLSDPERTLKLMQYEKDIVEEKQLLRSDFDQEEDYRSYKLQRLGINPETMVGTVDIKGTLVNRAGQTQACVELTSYESLKQQFQAQINEGAKTIVMQIDSNGGEAYRLFGAANAVRKMADENGVHLISYVDGTSASAAFGFASIADEIIANPQARVGSVGVVIQLYNDSKYLEKNGVERSFVYAGKNKIPFDDQGSFTEDFISGLQQSVDKSYAQFTKFIATNRNMTVESVVETNAKVLDADEALQIGFVDKIMEIEDFEHYLSGTSNQSNQNTISYEENMSKENDGGKTVEVAQLTDLQKVQSQLADMQTQFGAKETELTSVLGEKEKLETSLADLQKELKDAQEAKQSLADQIATIQADALQAERKAKLEVVLGTENDQVATLLASTQSLDETAFGAIVAAMQAKVDIEDKTMVEKGNSAKQDADIPTYQDRLKATAKAQQSK